MIILILIFKLLLVECSDGYYGNDCHTTCGYCLQGRVCNRLNGTCDHGCINHFKEPTCAGNEVDFLAQNC